MKIAHNIKLIIISLFIYQSISAQQDPQFTQYMYNHGNINPAYSGSVDHLSIFGQYRAQWIGLDGAPSTASISGSTPLDSAGLGSGVHVSNDRIGAMSNNTLAVDLSYTIDLDYRYKMAFGIKGSANLLNVDYTKLDVYHPIEQTNINNSFSPNIGAGIFLYSKKAYVGLSVPYFLKNTIYNDNYRSRDKKYSIMNEKPHLYLTGGYVFDINEDIKFKPATLIKAVSGAPLQVDFTANIYIIDKITVGAAYRWDASVSGLVGCQIVESIFIGYSYDADTTKLANYNSGSHEIIMRFEVFNKKKRLLAPRFF